MTAPTGDTGRARITFGDGNFYDLGPRCTTCHHHEAHCANHGRCCETCSHFRPKVIHGLRRPGVRSRLEIGTGDSHSADVINLHDGKRTA